VPAPIAITIRPLETPADFHAAEALQREVWSWSEIEITPLHVLATAARNGGLVLGAFDSQQLVGFLFGFLGTDEADPGRPALARLKHCSHQLGVLPNYQNQGIGYRLKLAQRDFVLKQGVRLVTWTYDPLESRNARLNIAKLGAVCRSYRREPYGVMEDALNAGVPADRFQVDWWVTSARVKERLFGRRGALTLESFTSAGAVILNPTTATPEGLARPSNRPPALAGMVALIEIPSDFQTLKSRDLELAKAWRQHTRALFEAAFAAGYLITDFFYESFEGRWRSFYALSHGEARIEYSEN
jgi:predicted GNAT superfamily acetyltransferase